MDEARQREQREQRDAETSPHASQMGKVGVATALAAGAGLVFAGLNEIVKRKGDAATVEAPKTWGEFHHKLAPLIEHIVFDKYSADGETVRATDMRRVVERLFGPRSAQDMVRHRVGQDTGVVSKQQFMDWMLRASHVPTDEAAMDKLHKADVTDLYYSDLIFDLFYSSLRTKIGARATSMAKIRKNQDTAFFIIT